MIIIVVLPALTAEARALLAFTPLQYMLDTAEINPYFVTIYTDNSDNPRCSALLFGHNIFVGGEVILEFYKDLAGAFIDDGSGKHWEYLVFFHENGRHEAAIKNCFNKVYDETRSLYKFAGVKPPVCNADEINVTRIDRGLLDAGLGNTEMIVNEVLGTGTYRDMDDFCNRGIGYTYIENNRVCSFCTSEYPSETSIAIGIEVEKPYQKRGVATAMTKAFVKTASQRYANIYWECVVKNTASSKTALRSGFERIAEYPSLFVYLL